MDEVAFHKDLTSFLIENNCLLFGDFVLKSGRKSPYFINTAVFNNAKTLARLANFYAQKIYSVFNDKVNIIYGPAYKGIPLCISIAFMYYNLFNINVGYLFDRKEAKTHGEKGIFVGQLPKTSENIVIVDDVITTGDTKKEAINLLKTSFPNTPILGVFVLVDREERVDANKTAVQIFEEDMKIKIYPLIKITSLVNYIPNNTQKHIVLEYLKKQGILYE
ncbi:MAG: orotate phosphoribosyltransferase [Candidatus Aenigmatarchaeota archaeon]